jgi:NAD(P)-dependent dehydrogenase (short-subunit alcohol dehydrogenase family)
MVEHFAAQGSKVAFLDVDEDAADKLVKEVFARGSAAPVFLHCDLKDIAGLRAAIAEIENRCGAIRVLVNNAANDDRHKFAEVTPEYWDDRMAVNLRHQFFAIQAVVPSMADAGGGSKAAIVGLTRTMAHELGGKNIRVNSVVPGSILTERQRRLWLTPEYEAEILASQALKRSLLPEDVARLVLFLASDDSSAITNQAYVIDGGWV